METALSGTRTHEEHQSFWLVNVIVVVVAAGIVLTASLTGITPNNVPLDTLLPICALVVAAFVMVWGFSRLNVVVTTTEIKFGFPIWHRHAAVSQVEVGDVVKIPWWYGVGLHYVGRMWVYNARLGRGVQIQIDGRRYLIGSDNPERLQAALWQVAPRREKV